jgi:hypothetical protein
VDSNDIDLITESIGSPVFGSTDPRDANGDGLISAADVTACTAQCTQTGCALQ